MSGAIARDRIMIECVGIVDVISEIQVIDGEYIGSGDNK